MILSYPTKNGTGISIFGNCGDLMALYNTIHHFATTLDENKNPQKAQFQLLMNFSYEVRKASSGQRLTDKFTFDGDKIQHTFYGFQIVWTDILIFISVLRHTAGYYQSDKLHQSTLYLLEYVVGKALYDYDPQGANQIKDFIAQRINICDNYAFLIYQALHIRFVTDKPGKTRFRKITHLLSSYFSPWQQDYKELVASLQQSAKKQNCEIADLEFSEFPEIVW